MAKINNQAVIQKLIDELKLYPGADTIPTEIADKILAVYQINSEELTVSGAKATIVRQAEAALTTTTIYTTSATEDFYLTNVAMSSVHNSDGGAGGTPQSTVNVTIDSVSRVILMCRHRNDAGEVEAQCMTNSLNLQNPIKIDKGTNITVINNSTDGIASASIVGYYS